MERILPNLRTFLYRFYDFIPKKFYNNAEINSNFRGESYAIQKNVESP